MILKQLIWWSTWSFCYCCHCISIWNDAKRKWIIFGTLLDTHWRIICSKNIVRQTWLWADASIKLVTYWKCFSDKSEAKSNNNKKKKSECQVNFYKFSIRLNTIVVYSFIQKRKIMWRADLVFIFIWTIFLFMFRLINLLVYRSKVWL